MNNRRMFFAACVAVSSMAMCQVASAQDQTNTTTPIGNLTEGSRLSVGDEIFLMDLIHANALEVELSRIARRQAASTGVSDFANTMIHAHSDLQNQLFTSYGNRSWIASWVRTNPTPTDRDMGYMNSTNTSPPASGAWNNWMFLDPSDWETIRHLDGLSGEGFDREYIQMMVRDHHKIKAEMWKEQNDTLNSDIKTLITATLPTVSSHLEMARGMSFSYQDPFDVSRGNAWSH